MTRNALNIVSRLCVFILLGAQALSQTVTVTIDTSSVLGSNENPADIESFLGITYGIASRFKRSSPISYLAPAEAIVNATTFGVACSQTVTAVRSFPMSVIGYGANFRVPRAIP